MDFLLKFDDLNFVTIYSFIFNSIQTLSKTSFLLTSFFMCLEKNETKLSKNRFFESNNNYYNTKNDD